MATTGKTSLCWSDIPGAPDGGDVLARLDDIPDGGASILALKTDDKPFGIILLRSGDTVFAYVNRCAHFGVPLASKAEHLYAKPHESIGCSVHYARYRWHDGVCEQGECEGELLLKIPVVIVDGRVLVSDS